MVWYLSWASSSMLLDAQGRTLMKIAIKTVILLQKKLNQT
jgi:hypothetical protein